MNRSNDDDVTPRGLLIDCHDVAQRFSLFMKMLDIYREYVILAVTPQEGWRAFADDVFERFMLSNEWKAGQRHQLEHFQRAGFESRTRNMNHVSMIETSHDSAPSVATLWTMAASMHLYNESHCIAAPKGISDHDIENMVEILDGGFFGEGWTLRQCLSAYMQKICSIPTDFLLVMPLWGECNPVSLLLARDERVLDAIRALPLNQVDFSHEIVFRNPFDGPSLEPPDKTA